MFDRWPLRRRLVAMLSAGNERVTEFNPLHSRRSRSPLKEGGHHPREDDWISVIATQSNEYSLPLRPTSSS